MKALLLYRASTDSFGCKAFHEKCDNKGAILILIKTSKDLLIGGFSSIGWSSSCEC